MPSGRRDLLARLPVLHRSRAEAVTEKIAQREAENEGDYGKKCRIHSPLLRGTEQERQYLTPTIYLFRPASMLTINLNPMVKATK